MYTRRHNMHTHKNSSWEQGASMLDTAYAIRNIAVLS